MSPEISPERVDAAIEEAKDASQYQVYKYPWTELPAKLRDQGHDHFWLLGYGSLISQVSSARTIDVSERSCRLPAIAFGARRQFSYRIPQAFLAERYGVTDGTRYSALDCKVTYDRGDALNGILTRVFIDDIEAFRQREYAYDLKPIPVFEWDHPERPHRIAYALDLPPVGDSEDHPYATDTPPQPGYYRLCRIGALTVSESFLQAYLDSTYLGDGVTPVSEWEKQSGVVDG